MTRRWPVHVTRYSEGPLRRAFAVFGDADPRLPSDARLDRELVDTERSVAEMALLGERVFGRDVAIARASRWIEIITIHVHVTGGELKTDHSFYLAGQRFLTLRYEIEHLLAASA
jgi:hypothetical protein